MIREESCVKEDIFTIDGEIMRCHFLSCLNTHTHTHKHGEMKKGAERSADLELVFSGRLEPELPGSALDVDTLYIHLP